MIDYSEVIPFISFEKNKEYTFEILKDGIQTKRVSEKTDKSYTNYMYKIKLINTEEEITIGRKSFFVTDHIKMIQLANEEFNKRLDSLALLRFSYINHFIDGKYNTEIKLLTVNPKKNVEKVINE